MSESRSGSGSGSRSGTDSRDKSIDDSGKGSQESFTSDGLKNKSVSSPGGEGLDIRKL